MSELLLSYGPVGPPSDTLILVLDDRDLERGLELKLAQVDDFLALAVPFLELVPVPDAGLAQTPAQEYIATLEFREEIHDPDVQVA